MSNLIGIRGVIGVVILSVISAFLVGGIIMSIFSSIYVNKGGQLNDVFNKNTSLHHIYLISILWIFVLIF